MKEMIHSIRVLAGVTFKESIRDRILLVLAVFSLLLLGATIFLSSISLDQDSKIIIDFGLFGIYLFGVLISLFIGASTIVKELDHRTAYTVITRPIKRSWYILGKFFGMASTLFVLTLFMALVFFALVTFRMGISAIDASLILAIIYIYLELLILIAMMLCFSTFTSSIMSVIYGLAVFIIGHSTPVIVSLIRDASQGVRFFYLAIYYIFPNLEKFNLRNDAVYHINPEPREVLLVVVYTVVLCAFFLGVASNILKKQEL